jgi:broad specificity phosphatase PhoE
LLLLVHESLVARHAETNYNVLDLCNDSPNIDVHLTPKGVEQAELLATTLRTVDFDLIITSDFPRTKQTAKILNKHPGTPLTSDSRINDVLTGFEGRSVKEFREARQSAQNKWTVRLNGGESFEDEKKRVADFLQDLKQRQEKCVLVVTHQAIARLIYANIFDIPNEEVNSIEVSNTRCFNFEI